MALKTHNKVIPFYHHFEPSEMFGTAFQCHKQAELTHAKTFFRGVGRYTVDGAPFCYLCACAKYERIKTGIQQRLDRLRQKVCISIRTSAIEQSSRKLFCKSVL